MLDWDAIQSLLARDPARRGLVSSRVAPDILAYTSLESAAHSLAQSAGTVAITTGFAVAGSNGMASETDGPPGALYLARILRDLGRDLLLIADQYSLPALLSGCQIAGIEPQDVIEFPSLAETAGSWIDKVLASPARPLTHLIAIERVGPSHSAASFAAQSRDTSPPWADFERALPPSRRNVCHNMRGESIDEHSPPVHLLFDAINQRQLPIVTIGLADGGNEIGMGCVPWELLAEAIPSQLGGRIACRVATQHLIIAGVSNWAAYALALSVAAWHDRLDLAVPLDANYERALVQHLVEKAGVVDGITRLRQATVDGLPLETYLQTLIGLRRIFALPD